MADLPSKSGPFSFVRFSSVFLFSFLLFSLSVFWLEITRIDVRFAIFVDEIANYPLSVFPTINGEPYPDYPVTMTLIAWLFSGCGHFINQWTLSLFSILCGSLTIALTWQTGERMKHGTGWIAAALMFMTMEFVTTITGFGIDIPVMASGALMLYLLEERLSAKWLPGVFFLLLIFCFLIRGPMGLLLLGAAVGGWLLFAWDWKKVILWGILGAITGGICMAGGIYLILTTGGKELYQSFLEWQITSRMAADDLFFYVLDGPIVFSPCTAFAILTLVLALWKKIPGLPALRPIFGFLLLPLILLSIPGCKHLRYMMITIPAFALIGGWGIRESFRLPVFHKILKFVFWLLGRFGWICSLIAAVVIISVSILLFCSFTNWIFRLFLLLLFPAAGLFFFKKKGFLACIIRTGIIFAVLFTQFVFPVMSFREMSEEFVRTAETFRTGRLYFYQVGVDHEDLKYLQFIPREQRLQAIYLFPSYNAGKDKYAKMYRQTAFDRIAQIRPGDLIILRDRDVKDIYEDAEKHGMKPIVHTTGRLGHKKYAAVSLCPR